MRPISFFHAHLRPADFTRLAANDLPKREADTLRRHLSVCAHCRAEWQSVQAVWQAARDEQTRSLAAPPDELRARIFAALPTPPARSERKPAMLAFLFDRPVAFASLAAAATVVVGVSALTYGPAVVFHAPRAVAFEDVEAAMNGIKTATWSTQTIITFPPSSSEKDKVIQYRPSENYAQINPPRLATLVPAYHTKEAGDGQAKTTLYIDDYALTFDHDGRTFYKTDAETLSRDDTHSARDAVRRAILFPRELLRTTPPTHYRKSPYTNAVSTIIEQTPWKSAPDTLNGKAVVRLQNHVTRTFTARQQSDAKPFTLTEENTIWADADTYRIVRRELHWLPLGPKAADIKHVFDNYRYNAPLPKGVFDVPIPPVGVPFVFHDTTARALQSWRGSTVDHEKIRATLERAARLWNAKETNDFFQMWDFDFSGVRGELLSGRSTTPAEIAETKRHWRARAEKGVPYQSWQLENFKVAPHLGGGIYVRDKATDPFPPTGRPIDYSATCDVLAVLTPGAKPVPCSMTATFHRVGNEFRITYLNMYNREMGVGNGISWQRK